MRRVLLSAAIAAFALAGLTAGGSSAEGPLECNNPKYARACETVNAIVDIGGVPPVPTLECNNPKYARACETVRELIGSGA